MSINSRTPGHFSQTLEAVVRNLAGTGRGKKQLLSIALDASMALLALCLAFWLRPIASGSSFSGTSHVFVIVPLVTVIVFASFGIYRWVVRSTNRRLYNQLIKACLLSSALMMAVMYLFPVSGNPRAVIVIFGLLLLIGTVSLRFLWHGLFDTAHQGEPIAVYGAGVAGQQLVNLLAQASDYRPVLFLDDNPSLQAHTVAGLPVFDGHDAHLADVLASREVSRIVLAMPMSGALVYRGIYERLAPLNLHVQTIPGVSELMSGTASHDQIRDVTITDILGREEVVPDPALLNRCVRGKVVLVTGGGGSIGSELCRQIMALGPRKLIVLDSSEANLYQIGEELHGRVERDDAQQQDVFKLVLCSVTDRASLAQLFKRENIDAVYHAAAYKHVPIVEAQPEQGTGVNVFGTRTVLDLAVQYHASQFILISTDKAVRPTNAMGASKRVAELVLQARQRCPANRTCIAMVRFGNVLGSSGSVVPKFRQQIQQGGPITLTDKDITRYFMTIPEASQLVLQAGAIATGGEVFVLDMGEPVRIFDLAETMVRLYGKRLKRETGNEQDIDIVTVGLRPGEKLYEEMFITDSHRQTAVSKVWTANEAWLTQNELDPLLDNLQRLVDTQDRSGLRQQLLSLALDETPRLIDQTQEAPRATPDSKPEIESDRLEPATRWQPTAV